MIAQRHMFCLGVFFAVVCMPVISTTSVHAQQPKVVDDDDYIWLENGEIKVGLKKSSGGAIAWIGQAGSGRNLINSFDRGRLVQQSWYGKEDGSLWNGKPWRWNPVQGGDWKGRAASVLREQHDASSSFVKTQPVHWASGEDLTECSMEQTITLQGQLVHIRFYFEYTGSETHPARHQELPAFFVDASLDTLVFYDGDSPWSDAPLTRSQPGFPNEYKKITEHWAAYIDEQDFGIGCSVPKADEMTCYRFGADPKSRSSCSYLAPIRTLAVTPGFKWDYDVWITIGSVQEIRSRFQQVIKSPSP